MALPTASRQREWRRRALARFADARHPRGLLIAMEGPDGSGKTTQRKLFKTWLKSEGYDVVTTKWNSSALIKPPIKRGQAGDGDARAQLLRGRPGRHQRRRSGRKLPAFHRARDQGVRIARADLQL